MQHPIPLTIHDVGTQQHDVAGLCICKHLTAEQIRIGILQPARKRKEHRRQEGLRHLPMMFCFHITFSPLFAPYYNIFLQLGSYQFYMSCMYIPASCQSQKYGRARPALCIPSQVVLE